MRNRNLRRLATPATLLVAGLALLATGCGDDDLLGANEGRVRFVLSSDGGAGGISGDEIGPSLSTGGDEVTPPSLHGGDDDGDRTGWFQSARVTFSSILGRDQDGVLWNVDMELPVTLDVMKMEKGKQVVLPGGVLPEGTYDQVVVVMTQVEGVLHDETVLSITPPGGGWTAIVPICPFVVESGSTAEIALTWRIRNAFSWKENRYHFQPRFTCEGGDSGTSG